MVYQLVTILIFYKVACKFFDKKTYHYVTTFVFITLYLSDLFESLYSNADNFILLPILISINLFLNKNYKMSALVMGIAFSIKQNTLLEFIPVFLTYCIYLYQQVINKNNKYSLKEIRIKIKDVIVLGSIFLLPYVIYSIYFAFLGKDIFSSFLNHVFLDRITSHVTDFNLEYFDRYFSSIYSQTKILWILVLIFIVTFIYKVINKRLSVLNTNNYLHIYLFLWVIFSFISVSAGGKFFPHYFLELLPPLILASFYIFKQMFSKEYMVVILVLLLFATFKYEYVYERFKVLITNKSAAYSMAESNSVQAIEFIKNNQIDNIFMYDYEPFISIYSDKFPVTNYGFKYLYVDFYKILNQKIYSSITGYEDRQNELYNQVKSGNVKYIVVNIASVVNKTELEHTEFLTNILKNYDVYETFDTVWIYKYKDKHIKNKYEDINIYSKYELNTDNDMFYINIVRDINTPDVFVELICGDKKWAYPENGINLPLVVKQDDKNVQIQGKRFGSKMKDCDISFKNFNNVSYSLKLVR